MRWFVLLLLGCSALSDDDSASSAVTLIIQNESGRTVERATYWDCAADQADAVEIPLLPEGIATGGSATYDLGASGCWNVGAEGGGCCYVNGTTGDMVEGETYTWMLMPEDLLCFGR